MKFGVDWPSCFGEQMLRKRHLEKTSMLAHRLTKLNTNTRFILCHYPSPELGMFLISFKGQPGL